jgi:hypothetical protein
MTEDARGGDALDPIGSGSVVLPVAGAFVDLAFDRPECGRALHARLAARPEE